jgi:hypothetical protein
MLVLQQFLESSSTLWLVLLIQTITSGGQFLPYLLLYLGSIVIPVVPGCLAYILRVTWRQEAQRAFIKEFVDLNRNNIGDWGNKGLKEQKLSVLASEGPAALTLLIDYSYDFINYVLSVFFNLMILSLVVEPLFAMAFSLSLTGAIVLMRMRRRAQRHLTKKALTARIDLSQSLLAAWDNVLIGNHYNFRLWFDRTGQRLNKCLQRNLDLERFDQLMAIFISLMTFIPAIIVVIYFALKHQHDLMQLSAFVITLPTLFLILSYTHQTLTLAFRWGVHKSKLTAIYYAIQSSKDPHKQLEKKVRWDKLTLEESPIAPDTQVSLPGPRPILSPVDIILKTSQPGRHTLSGEPGSGKSTALILIKNVLADRAFLLPRHNHLSFDSETNKYSTGESLKNRLIEILDNVTVDVLLLDEWDASSDHENQEQLHDLINQLAATKCVIEVRQR